MLERKRGDGQALSKTTLSKHRNRHEDLFVFLEGFFGLEDEPVKSVKMQVETRFEIL